MTYSIIGRDPEAGEIGIAIQSRWFHAGQDLAWIEPGVGAVCTQAFMNPVYGPRGLELMRGGARAADALAAALAEDDGSGLRQVAMADAAGSFAQHTGDKCVEAAGHVTGANCCAQGNMLTRDSCWGAMVAAFEAEDGSLTDRLLAALDAAEGEEGDARGRQAARILVRRDAPAGAPWDERVIDLQVIDHPEPVPELRRLVTVKRAYDLLGRAFDLSEEGDMAGAAEAVDAARGLAPGDDQIAFWGATILGGAGRIGDAIAAMQEASRANPRWPEFVRRCIAAGILPPEAAPLADAG